MDILSKTFQPASNHSNSRGTVCLIAPLWWGRGRVFFHLAPCLPKTFNDQSSSCQIHPRALPNSGIRSQVHLIIQAALSFPFSFLFFCMNTTISVGSVNHIPSADCKKKFSPLPCVDLNHCAQQHELAWSHLLLNTSHLNIARARQSWNHFGDTSGCAAMQGMGVQEGLGQCRPWTACRNKM